MNSRKNKYFIKLITSYSLLLVIVLILGIVFHFILSHNAKQELLNENMLSLKMYPSNTATAMRIFI